MMLVVQVQAASRTGINNFLNLKHDSRLKSYCTTKLKPQVAAAGQVGQLDSSPGTFARAAASLEVLLHVGRLDQVHRLQIRPEP